jgi:hypothetical protein
MRLGPVCLLICLSTLGFAGSWSGYLVDSRCFANERDNVTWEEPIGSDDMSMQVRACVATSKTKHFAIVLPDWTMLKLDGAESGRAAAVAHSVAPKSTTPYCVTVVGVRRKDMILASPVVTASVRRYR